MRKDEWILTNEMRRLNKYGFILKAEKIDENRYNIRFQQSDYILEPNCSVEEVMGIINSSSQLLEMYIRRNK